MNPYSTELCHHGILGQKWGVRRFQNKDGSVTAAGAKRYQTGEAKSAKASAHRALAKVYGINENFYSKHTKNTALASMNKAAKNEQLKKAKEAQSQANKRLMEKINAKNIKTAEKNAKKEAKEKELAPYKNVDPNAAKNKTTKRAAYDYHNLSDHMFRAKYQTTKKTFKKRYEKTKGDTYSLGKKKAAVALAILAATPTKNVYVGNGKYIKTGRAAIGKSLAWDMGATAVNTNVGYKRAERKFNEKKEAYKNMK